MKVIDSRPSGVGCRRRRHACLLCPARVTTYEQAAVDQDGLLDCYREGGAD